MKISIITVCYNSVKTIGDTLRSVREQTYENIEHIIIDGDSSDGTIKLVNALCRSGSIIISESDKGIYDAMNKGVRLATGDVIGFLNADDMYSGSWVLERVMRNIQRRGIFAVFGDAEFVRSENLDKPIRRYRSDRFRPDRIAWGLMPAHPTLFLKREVFEKYGSFKTDYRIAGDFELVARMFHSGTLNFQYLPEVLVRMRTGGVSTGGFRSSLLLNREVMRACRENGIATNWPKLLSKYPAKLLEFVLR